MQTITCQRCGTCCRKGGPLLHTSDLPILGQICLSNLLTLRKAELVHDPVQNRLLPLENEVIKIAGTGEKAYPWHCVLHNASGCNLHPLRPAQCQALFCQDTEPLKAQYQQERVARKDVLCPDLWALAQAHEEQCPLTPLVTLAQEAQQSTTQSDTPLTSSCAEEILEHVRYDAAFRQLCTEKGAAPVELLPLLLGRPTPIFLRSLGLAVRKNKQNGHIALYNLANSPYFSSISSL